MRRVVVLFAVVPMSVVACAVPGAPSAVESNALVVAVDERGFAGDECLAERTVLSVALTAFAHQEGRVAASADDLDDAGILDAADVDDSGMSVEDGAIVADDTSQCADVAELLEVFEMSRDCYVDLVQLSAAVGLYELQHDLGPSVAALAAAGYPTENEGYRVDGQEVVPQPTGVCPAMDDMSDNADASSATDHEAACRAEAKMLLTAAEAFYSATGRPAVNEAEIVEAELLRDEIEPYDFEFVDDEYRLIPVGDECADVEI
jgi:hypothetical protein